jgi:hypothetical protein
MDATFGHDRSDFELAGLRRGQLERLRDGLGRRNGAEAIRQPAWTFHDYPFNVYARPALVLRTLEGLVGPRTVARIMRTYAERWRYRHPSSDDFYAVASEVAGRDLRPFFRQAVESPAIVDYVLGDIRTRAGRTVVEVRRVGDLEAPVDVAFKFAGRPLERRRWDAAARTSHFVFDYDTPLEWADVDPDRRIAVDADWMNNGRSLKPDRRVPASLTARWLLVVEQVLGWLAF